MANEITLGVSVAVVKGLMAMARTVTGLQLTMAGTATVQAVKSVGTVKETLDLLGVSAPGYVLLRNLDATNFVEVGEDADTPFLKLKAREVAVFRMAGTTLSAKADTAAVNLEYMVLSD